MSLEIRAVDPAGPVDVDALGALLHACVMAGASIGFIDPFTPGEARGFWRDTVAPLVAAGAVTLIEARSAGTLVGTAQLVTATPRNQPHRADVAKVLVHPGRRREGIARRMMAVLEDEARVRGKTLLTLDTRTGDAAEPLYRELGYAVSGIIPGYCLDVFSPKLDSTTIMYKTLA